MTDWEARVAKAKRDGSWYGPDEEPSPYPPRAKWVGFWSAFTLTLVAVVVLGALLRLVAGRPGSPLSGAVLVDNVFQGIFPALFAGWAATRPPRRRPARNRCRRSSARGPCRKGNAD